MSKTPFHLLALCCSLGLVSCSSTGGPSGGLIGLVTGGLLGHLIDDNSNDPVYGANGYAGTTGAYNGTTGTGTGTANGSNNLLLGTTTTNSTDPMTGATTEAVKNQYAVINNNPTMLQTKDFFGRNKGAITGAAAGAVAGLLTDQVRQGEIQKKYDEGYAKAKSDAVKEFYWLKRDAQKSPNGGEGPPVQYRYYEVEVPAHTTSDGVFIDRHKRIIEVVE